MEYGNRRIFVRNLIKTRWTGYKRINFYSDVNYVLEVEAVMVEEYNLDKEKYKDEKTKFFNDKEAYINARYA